MIEEVPSEEDIVLVTEDTVHTMIIEIAEIETFPTAPYLMLILQGKCRLLPMLVAITNIGQVHLLLVLVLIPQRDFP